MIEYELGVIGVGHMGEAILRGVLKDGSLPRNAIVAYDPNKKREQTLAMEFGILCAESNSIPGSCPHVLLAVKPQSMGDVLAEIAPVVRPDATVISIAAGITTSYIDERLGGKGRIVRVMPNTPMCVGVGVAAVARGPRATPEDVHWTQRLFATSGIAVVMEEEMMDVVTGLSGSGPAYLYYLVEAMTAAAVAEGMDPDVAEMLATQTCIGAARLLAQSKQPPSELRAAVATPGGTTERAMSTLDAAGVKDRIIEAVRAATQRSRELGK
ncbi:MAG TPA: pyrroline-5-carboxylate reductase [Phycisphaerae bacterium]|nr:pyrroline-5-carboxylate reductase [Phycisphaerae bacterium]